MSMNREELKRKVKTELVMTMIQSVQYVTGGSVFAKNIAGEYNLDQEDEAVQVGLKTAIAEVSIELLDPLWAEYRTLKNPPPELETPDFWDFVRDVVMNIEPKDMNSDQQIKVAFDTTEAAVQTYRENQEDV